ERLVGAEASRLGIETRVLRPAALVDWTNPDMPGLVGRRLFGAWHLGFGRSRAHGWRGRMVWLPIPLFAMLFTAVRVGLGLATLRFPAHLAVWSIFRP